MPYTPQPQRTDVNGHTYVPMEADFAPTDAKMDDAKWRECALCAWVDREAQGATVGGRWYCNRNGCATEKSGGSAKG